MTFYACFFGAGLKWQDSYVEKSGLTVFPTEPKAMEIYGRLMKDAMAKAVAADGAGRHPILRKFTVP